jgi:hypothetical protein
VPAPAVRLEGALDELCAQLADGQVQESTLINSGRVGDGLIQTTRRVGTSATPVLSYLSRMI